MTWRVSDRSGLTTGSVTFGIAVLTLVLALAYPTLRARSFGLRVAEAGADIEALRRGAEGHLRESGTWPSSGPPGAIPIELIGAFPGDVDLGRETYTIQWVRFEVVDHVEVPPEPNPEPNPLDLGADSIPPTIVAMPRRIGGIVVHTGDDALLAELLDQYGSEASFVRDTTWTLVLPARAAGS